MTIEEWGFILLTSIIANGAFWLFGWGLEIKDKIIIPNIIIYCIGIIFALKMMGVE